MEASLNSKQLWQKKVLKKKERKSAEENDKRPLIEVKTFEFNEEVNTYNLLGHDYLVGSMH